MTLPAAVALLLGLLHAATFAPWQRWWLGLLALAGLFALLVRERARDARPRRLAGISFAFGVGWFGAGLAWLYTSMHDYGGMPAPMAAAAVLLFAGYLSLFPAAATWAAWHFCGTGARPGPRLALAVTAAWTLAELARGYLLTGFPWLGVGYAQLDGPLDRLAAVGGVYSIGAAAIAVAFLLAWAASQAPRIRVAPIAVAAPLAAAVLLTASLGQVPRSGWTVPAGEPLRVALLQGNVEQDMKFRADRLLPTLERYTELLESGDEPLAVLPETAWTLPWEATPDPIARRILAQVERGRAVAIGMPLRAARPADAARDAPPALSNSVLLLAPGGPDSTVRAQRYDKRHLVPFGEFVPTGFGWFVRMMHIPLGDFARGAARQTPFAVADQRIAFNVCYEDLFGEELIGALSGDAPATILANVSNIAWFGDSHALPQHLQIARMRTLETGRPMLRATNTGITAAIDASGRVLARLDPHVTGRVTATVQGMSGTTPYARTGNLPVAAAAAVALLAAAVTCRTRRRGQTR